MYLFSPILHIFFHRKKIQTSTACFYPHTVDRTGAQGLDLRWEGCPRLAAKGGPPRALWQCYALPPVLLQLGDLASQKCLQILEFRLWQYRHTGWSQSSLTAPILACEEGQLKHVWGRFWAQNQCNKHLLLQAAKEQGTLAQTSLISLTGTSDYCHTLSVRTVPHYFHPAY